MVENMKKKIEIGRIKGDIFGYKRSLLVVLEIGIRKEERETLTIDLEKVNEYEVLTISGDVWNTKRTDILCGGQICDDIKEWLDNNKFVKLYIEEKKLRKLLEIWERWHLNDLHAGTRKQEKAIREWRKKNNITGWAYDKECEYLKSIGLLVDRGYEYGSSWLYEPLPKDVVEFIKSL